MHYKLNSGIILIPSPYRPGLEHNGHSINYDKGNSLAAQRLEPNTLIPKGLDSVPVRRIKSPQTSAHGQKEKEDVILKTRD